MPNLFRIIDTHAQLNALGPPADDHPQYLSLINNRTVSGLHTFNTAISGLPAFLLGPSNFGVLVSGLNAQYLNGYTFSQISGLIGTGGGGSGISIGQLNNVSGYLDTRITTVSGLIGGSSNTVLSGYLDNRITAISGMAGGILAVSGYLDTRDQSISGYLISQLSLYDTVINSSNISGYLAARIISVSGYDSSVYTSSSYTNLTSGYLDNRITVVSGIVGGVLNLSGYLDGRDQSISGYVIGQLANYGTVVNDTNVSGYLDARLTRVSGLAGGIINVSGYLSSLINTNASDYPSGNIFYTDGVGVRTNNKFKYNQASNGNISLQVGNTGDTISNTLQLGSTTLIDNLDNTPNGLLIKQNNLGIGNLYFFDVNHRIANSNGSAMGLTAPNFVLTRNASDANTAGNQIFFALQPTYAQASGTAVNTSLLIKRLGFASGTGTNLFLDCQNASGVSLFNIDAVTGSVSGTYISTTSGTFGGVNIKTLIEPEISLPYSSGIVTNASSGSFFKISASGNFTLYNPINNTDCQILRWKVIQDASGSRLLTLDSNFKTGPFVTITLSTASGAIDYLSAKYDNDSGKFHIVSFLNGY